MKVMNNVVYSCRKIDRAVFFAADLVDKDEKLKIVVSLCNVLRIK